MMGREIRKTRISEASEFEIAGSSGLGAARQWGCNLIDQRYVYVRPGGSAIRSRRLRRALNSIDAALTRRVANAPEERRALEQGWLPGWRKRLETYLQP